MANSGSGLARSPAFVRVLLFPATTKDGWLHGARQSSILYLQAYGLSQYSISINLYNSNAPNEVILHARANNIDILFASLASGHLNTCTLIGSPLAVVSCIEYAVFVAETCGNYILVLRYRESGPPAYVVRKSFSFVESSLHHLTARSELSPLQPLDFAPNNGTCMPSSTTILGPGIFFSPSLFGKSPIFSHISCSITCPGVMSICCDPHRNCQSGRTSLSAGVFLAS